LSQHGRDRSHLHSISFDLLRNDSRPTFKHWVLLLPKSFNISVVAIFPFRSHIYNLSREFVQLFVRIIELRYGGCCTSLSATNTLQRKKDFILSVTEKAKSGVKQWFQVGGNHKRNSGRRYAAQMEGRDAAASRSSFGGRLFITCTLPRAL